jgi:hypothetical protein
MKALIAIAMCVLAEEADAAELIAGPMVGCRLQQTRGALG